MTTTSKFNEIFVKNDNLEEEEILLIDIRTHDEVY